jgi:hypothetical protein
MRELLPVQAYLLRIGYRIRVEEEENFPKPIPHIGENGEFVSLENKKGSRGA